MSGATGYANAIPWLFVFIAARAIAASEGPWGDQPDRSALSPSQTAAPQSAQKPPHNKPAGLMLCVKLTIGRRRNERGGVTGAWDTRAPQRVNLGADFNSHLPTV